MWSRYLDLQTHLRICFRWSSQVGGLFRPSSLSIFLLSGASVMYLWWDLSLCFLFLEHIYFMLLVNHRALCFNRTVLHIVGGMTIIFEWKPLTSTQTWAKETSNHRPKIHLEVGFQMWAPAWRALAWNLQVYDLFFR